MDDIKVNDGGGLWDNAGLCDTLTVSCNDLLREICAGRYVGFAALIVDMVQRLSNLKKGIEAERADFEKQIAELRKLLDDINNAEGGDNNV